jgi:hypothetical protein
VLLFCGSSSIMQFGRTPSKAIGRFAFFGGTIIGLDNTASKISHGRVIEGLARLPGEKTMLLMFGNTDIDVTYYRHCAMRGVIDPQAHFTRCVTAYNNFLARLLEAARAEGSPLRVLILAPQLTPLRDSVFVEVTARHGGIRPDALRALGDRMDLSHGARIARMRAFNDALERDRLAADEVAGVFRIDTAMLDPEGRLAERFYPRNPEDHHATPRETLQCWRVALSHHLLDFHQFRPEAPPPTAG